MQKISDFLKKYKVEDKDKYVSREFQKYGYDLAEAMDDLKHVSLYIKIAKQYPRGLVEAAKNFIKDAYQVKSKPRLFMWKLKQLRDESEKKKASKNTD